MQRKIILAIGITEILIGTVTLLATIISLLVSTNTKIINIIIFVLITACISALLGIGLLKFKKTAYKLLIYFSSIVILSKILIWGGIITLNGSLETSVPAPVKNVISIAYHGFLILYLNRKNIEKFFVG